MKREMRRRLNPPKPYLSLRIEWRRRMRGGYVKKAVVRFSYKCPIYFDFFGVQRRKHRRLPYLEKQGFDQRIRVGIRRPDRRRPDLGGRIQEIFRSGIAQKE